MSKSFVHQHVKNIVKQRDNSISSVPTQVIASSSTVPLITKEEKLAKEKEIANQIESERLKKEQIKLKTEAAEKEKIKAEQAKLLREAKEKKAAQEALENQKLEQLRLKNEAIEKEKIKKQEEARLLRETEEKRLAELEKQKLAQEQATRLEQERIIKEQLAAQNLIIAEQQRILKETQEKLVKEEERQRLEQEKRNKEIEEQRLKELEQERLQEEQLTSQSLQLVQILPYEIPVKSAVIESTYLKETPKPIDIVITDNVEPDVPSVITVQENNLQTEEIAYKDEEQAPPVIVYNTEQPTAIIAAPPIDLPLVVEQIPQQEELIQAIVTNPVELPPQTLNIAPEILVATPEPVIEEKKQPTKENNEDLDYVFDFPEEEEEYAILEQENREIEVIGAYFYNF